MHKGKLFIGGKKIPGKGERFVSKNPARGTDFWVGNAASADQLDEAFEAAHKAFRKWRLVPLNDRAEILTAYADEVERNGEKLAAAISDEIGKARWDARTEVAGVISKAAISIKAFQERTPTKAGAVNTVRTRLTHRPHGVMGVIGPYNFPCHLANGHIVPAVLAGNTVVFKPSSWTPYSGELMIELWHKAGIPDGVINLVQGGGDIGRAMVAHPKLKGLLFTGGVPTGRAIAKSLAERLDVITALELGGNNPLIVWEARDLKAAAAITVYSAFISAGQRCTCARRLIVPDNSEGKKVIAAVVQGIKGVSVGMPDADPQPFIGSLITPEAAQDALDRQDFLEGKGGRVLARAERLPLGDAFITPGLIDVTDIKVRDDVECFGPILQVVRVKTFEAAIAQANNTAFGLSAGILTDNKALYEKFYAEIEAGVVNWNQPLPGASSAAPFGGVGLSGNHRPAAFYAADYCAWPMASLENAENKLTFPTLPPGLKI